MTKKMTRKPFSTLAKDITAIRKRPLTQDQIEDTNKILENNKDRENSIPKRKIARQPEAEK